MALLGKILGGTMGFMLGGPLGALAGAFIGNFFDKAGSNISQLSSSDSKNIGMIIALIALCAKMAKADGRVSQSEVAMLKKIFKVGPKEEQFVAGVFNKAKESSDGFEPYAQQLKEIFHGDKNILENFLIMLLAVAKADNTISSAESRMLHSIATIFGFDENEFRRITGIVNSNEELSPYSVLQVDENAANEIVKKAYLKLVKENHPDALIAKGMPEEFISAANKKLASINTAYEKIKLERAF